MFPLTWFRRILPWIPLLTFLEKKNVWNDHMWNISKYLKHTTINIFLRNQLACLNFILKWYILVLYMLYMCAKSLQSCPTPCNTMDHSVPGSFVHGILQAKILEWVAMPFSRGSSPPRYWTHISYISSLALHPYNCFLFALAVTLWDKPLPSHTKTPVIDS